jgi:hypothetical protein
MIAILLAVLIAQDGPALDQFRDRLQAASDSQAAYTPVEPADWVCANPLIARNYSQRVSSQQLTLRIADECVRPFRARPIQSEFDRHFVQSDMLAYTYAVSIFQSEIEQRILQARRRDAIKLN